MYYLSFAFAFIVTYYFVLMVLLVTGMKKVTRKRDFWFSMIPFGITIRAIVYWYRNLE